LQDFLFFTPRTRLNKRMLSLCVGNHELYMRRRRPDTIEVQQMKDQARQDKAQRHAERAALAREKQARLEAERRMRELEERLKRFEEEARAAQDALARSISQAKDLEAKASRIEDELKERERMRQEAELQRRAAEEEARRKAEEAQSSLEDRERMARAVADAEAKAATLAAEMRAKEMESRALITELETAKRRQLEDAQMLLARTQSINTRAHQHHDETPRAHIDHAPAHRAPAVSEHGEEPAAPVRAAALAQPAAGLTHHELAHAQRAVDLDETVVAPIPGDVVKKIAPVALDGDGEAANDAESRSRAASLAVDSSIAAAHRTEEDRVAHANKTKQMRDALLVRSVLLLALRGVFVLCWKANCDCDLNLSFS
jgi:myosin heavy subunit